MPDLQRFAILAIPVISIALAILYSYLTERKIPSILPTITLGAIVQTTSNLLSATVVGKPIPTGVATYLIIQLGVLFIIFVWYLGIFAALRSDLQRHLADLLSEDKFPLIPDCITNATVLGIAEQLIEIDVKPSMMSGHKQQQREAFMKLARRVSATRPNTPFDENDLLPKHPWEHWYVTLGLLSAAGYAGALVVLIFVLL